MSYDFDDLFDFEIINYYYYKWNISEFSLILLRICTFFFIISDHLLFCYFGCQEVIAKNEKY